MFLPSHTSLLLGLLAADAPQQPVFEPVALEGDVIAGVGAITFIDNLAVNDSGDWRVEADTDHVDTDADSVLIGGGQALILREGQSLALPAGASLDSFDAVTLNNVGRSGWNFFLDGTTGTSDDSGLYLDDNLILQEGFLSTSPSFSAGTPYIGFFETKINDGNQILVVASVDDPLISSTVDRALVILEVDASGTLLGETVLAKEGDLLAGQVEFVEDFGTGPHNFAFNNASNVLFFANLTGVTTTDGAIYLDTALLAQEASPSPVAGRNWETLSSAVMDLNDAGDYVFRGNLDGDTADDEVIVSNGAVVAREGESPADIAPFRLTGFGTGPLLIDADGDVLWYGDWDDPDTTRDTGLFLNDQLIVQEGVTAINGMTLATLAGVQDAFSFSDNGDWILFEGSLTGSIDGAFRVSFPLLHLDPVPGIAGQMNTLEVRNATPAAAVYFAGSSVPGATNVNCGGGSITLDLGNPRELGFAAAGSEGDATLDVLVPPNLSGRTVYLQAVDSADCEVSNLVAFTLL